MSLKAGTLDNKPSELESSLVNWINKMMHFDKDWWTRFTSYHFEQRIIPILADFDEALSRRRQHCKKVNELNERLSRENERLKKILSDNWINQYIS